MKVLFVRLDHIGDCFLTLPAIREFKAVFPEAEISVLCKENTKEIFGSSGLVDEIFTLNPFHSTNNYEKRSGLFSVLRTFFILNLKGFDYIYNFRDHIIERIFFFLVRGKYKCSIKRLMYHYDIHIIKRNRLMLGHALDYKVIGDKDYVRLNTNILSPEIKKRLIGTVTGKILFHIGGSYMKKLPMKRLHELLTNIMKESKDIIPVRSSSDKFMFDDIEFLNINSITEWAFVCENAKGCICFDSGPMHIAAAHSKRLFAIFGSTSVSYFGPRGDHTKVFRPGGYTEDFIPGMKFSFERFGSYLQEIETDILKDEILFFFAEKEDKPGSDPRT